MLHAGRLVYAEGKVFWEKIRVTCSPPLRMSGLDTGFERVDLTRSIRPET